MLEVTVKQLWIRVRLIKVPVNVKVYCFSPGLLNLFVLLMLEFVLFFKLEFLSSSKAK